MKEILSIFPFLFKKQEGEKGEKGDRGDKGEKGDRGEKGDSIVEKLYPYVIPEIEGIELSLSHHFRSAKGLSPEYSTYAHYTNKIFDKYDFVAREQFVTAYEHLKLVVLNEEENEILHVPGRGKYIEIFKDFRHVPGSESCGIDISLSLKV